MPGTELYPFRRLWVDHLIHGTDRIYWEMDRDFHDPKPWSFQLQFGNTGLPSATDWENVGAPVINGYMAEDDVRRPGDYGKTLTNHYRVILRTPVGTYVSKPVSTYGILTESDWVRAREIVRKEKLRHKMVSRKGYLLKRYRYGEPCTECIDPLTGGIMNPDCPECGGTGFKRGYHPPYEMDLDMGPEAVIEIRSATEPPGPSRPVTLKGRVIGFPHVEKEDVWVDPASDQRWFFDAVYHLAEVRGQPIIIQADLKLAPYSDIVYKLGVDGQSDPPTTLPSAGAGTIEVNHDYGGPDELAYQINGVGVVGATVLVFDKCVWDVIQPPPPACEPGCAPATIPPVIDESQAVAKTYTTANGRWQDTLKLCPCYDYVLVLMLPGRFGPDVVELHVLPEEGETCTPSSSVSSQPSQSSQPSSFSSSAGMGSQ